MWKKLNNFIFLKPIINPKFSRADVYSRGWTTFPTPFFKLIFFLSLFYLGYRLRQNSWILYLYKLEHSTISKHTALHVHLPIGLNDIHRTLTNDLETWNYTTRTSFTFVVWGLFNISRKSRHRAAWLHPKYLNAALLYYYYFIFFLDLIQCFDVDTNVNNVNVYIEHWKSIVGNRSLQ